VNLQMNRKAGFLAHWREALVSAILTALLGLLLLATPAGDRLTSLSYDLLFAFRPDIPADDVVLVVMDEDSHRILKQPGSAPWDRALHARLIERLTALGARAIAFDVLFQGERDPDSDAQLARAAKESGRVAVAALMDAEIANGELIGWSLVRPFPALADAAPFGVIEEASEDGAVRRHFWNSQFTNVQSLAWQTARITTKQPPPPGADRWINYFGPPGWIPRVSYHRVFDTNDDSLLHTAFSNKVAFVGAGYTVGFTAGKGTDEFRTPYTRWTGRLSPGVEVVATTYLNLAHRNWLQRLAPWAEAALILSAAILLGIGLTMSRPLIALGAATLAVVAVPMLVYASAWRLNVWFPWLIISAAQIPCALAFALLTHTRRLQRAKASLEQRLVLATAAEVVRCAPPGTTGVLACRVTGALRVEMDPDSRIADVPGAPPIPDHQILHRIGHGGYGEVWLARDILGAFHAVKTVRRQSSQSERPLEREFEGLKRFAPISRSHPNLVHILHVGRVPGGIYYAMEVADDESTGPVIDPQNYSPKTLTGLLRRRPRLALAECLDLTIDIAAALEFLHQRQLVHRDVKPANIIFVNGAPKLADIGLVAEAGVTTANDSRLGTPGYMPPEGPGAPAGDVYSLGKLIYEMAFGFDSTRFPELPPALFERADEDGIFDLNRVLLKACENDPARRHRTAGELRDALLQLRETLRSAPLTPAL
jgi:CHASE2 domain-containing sensor protein